MFKGFNAFQRPIDGIRSRSSLGGVITLLAAAFALIMFLSQMFLYVKLDITHSLDIAPSFILNDLIIPTEGGIGKILSNRKKTKMSPSMVQYLNAIQENSIDIFIDVTFPKLNCKALDYSLNGLKFSSGEYQKVNGPSKLKKRRPTEFEYAQATGTSTSGKSRQRLASLIGSENSCNVKGTITTRKIGGEFNIFMSQETFVEIGNLVRMGIPIEKTDESTGGHNVSHYIHDIRFGETAHGLSNPLKGMYYDPDSIRIKDMNEKGTGVGLNQISVKLVPTKYKRFARRPKTAFQVSATNYNIQPAFLIQAMISRPGQILPGLAIHYDFDPLQITQNEQRENIFVFLSSLIGIVGGVFVTVGLVSQVLINTASVVKKMD